MTCETGQKKVKLDGNDFSQGVWASEVLIF